MELDVIDIKYILAGTEDISRAALQYILRTISKWV